MADRRWTSWACGQQRGVLLAAAALVAAATGTANAQPMSNAYGGIEAIPNNVSFNTVLRASDTNATVFGAASIAERVVFPKLREDGDWLFRFVSNTTYGGVTVPVSYITDDAHIRYGISPVDFSAVSLCGGIRTGNLGLFYASSMTSTTLAPGIGERAINGTVWALDLAAASLGGTKISKYSERTDINGGNTQADFIVGAQYDLGFMQARAGYVGSQGLFTNVSQADVRAFLSSVFDTTIGGVPYLRTGVEKLPLEPLGLDDAMSSVFVRKITMVAPFQDEVNTTYEDLRRAASFNLWTAHLQQLSIAKRFDLLVAVDMSTGTGLQELRAGFHSPLFHGSAPKDPDDEPEPEEGWGIEAGIVRVPSMYYYGMQGGTKLSLALEARAPAGRIKLSRNDPDLLAVFPFAYDAWNFSWEFGLDSVVSK